MLTPEQRQERIDALNERFVTRLRAEVDGGSELALAVAETLGELTGAGHPLGSVMASLMSTLIEEIQGIEDVTLLPSCTAEHRRILDIFLMADDEATCIEMDDRTTFEEVS